MQEEPNAMRGFSSKPGLSGGEWLSVGVGALCLLVAGYLGMRLQPQSARGSILEYADLSDTQAAPVAAILGEFRANLSYLLFMKTEEYLHSGIRYRPLTEKEKELGRAEIHHDFELMDARERKERHEGESVAHWHEGMPEHDHEHEDDHGHDHGHTHGAQLVPPKRWDVRGIFGDIERTVKPFEEEGEPERHGQVPEMLPWYRMATYLNPRLVKAYVIGGFVIAAYGGRLDEAEAFLREGVQLNPESPEVKEALGRLLMYRKDDPAGAKPLFEAALALGLGRKEMTEEEKFAVRRACTSLALLEWKTNQSPEAALNIVRQGLELFPEDTALEHLREQLGN